MKILFIKFIRLIMYCVCVLIKLTTQLIKNSPTSAFVPNKSCCRIFYNSISFNSI